MRIEDAESLKAQYWNEVCIELQGKIEMAINQLITCSPSEVERLQERIITFREVMTLPDEIIDRHATESYRKEL